MKNFRWIGIVTFAVVSVAVNSPAAPANLLTSPDNQIQIAIQISVEGSTNRPVWSATYSNTPIFTNCLLGLATTDAGELLAGARVDRVKTRTHDERIPVLFGKADHADDTYHETRFSLESTNHQKLDVVFRCYNDAIAFRYELADNDSSHSVTITDENTAFHVVGNPLAYAQYLENYHTSHEHNVTPVAFADLKPGTLLDMPLTLAWTNGNYVAITEAALRHYAGMSLMRPTNDFSHDELVGKLTPRPDGTKVVRPLPMLTPWRVALIGNRAGALLESGTLYCLNESSVIKDTSWIKPGKITFSWWNGDVFDGKREEPILSFAMAKKYIDFCASNNIPTHSLTSKEGDPIYPWYHQTKPGVAPRPDTDVTRPRDDFDLPTIRDYAKSKNIKLWTWVHQAALRGKVEPAFAAFEQMGWSGMMVDFFDHDDQDSVEFAEEILAAAARHHILIHLHGVWKPTGWQRTYPNLMNHEGSLNEEYLKWTKRCTPDHSLMMAFTRLVAGPMDYHLGGFRAQTRAQFKPQNIAPHVMGTRCFQLAMYVCFDNPNPMIADYPTAYIGQPGFDFLQIVPTWWDETRVLTGEPGQILVTARRSGDTWYVGAMTANQDRSVKLSLDFLRHGKYEATLWQDAVDADTDPNHLATSTKQVTAHDTLSILAATDGGFVARFNPAGK